MTADRLACLTPREYEVFGLVAWGHSHKEIAKRLGISPRTAEGHTENLRRKLGITSRAELVRLAVEARVLGP